MNAYRFSANTGFLWREVPFIDRIRRAAAAGFDAVEFHDEAQRADRSELIDVLAETGLPVLAINCRMGETAGAAAIPSQAEQAKRDIADAARIAEAIGAAAIHVVAGKVGGVEALATYAKNLEFALGSTELTVLIEPICREQIPGYFLNHIDQAAEILDDIDHPRLKIMFDCYHIHRESGDVLNHFKRHVHRIGHVQIAGAENRAEPFPGELDYGFLLRQFQHAGYDGAFGCEYHPKKLTDDGLGWRELISA